MRRNMGKDAFAPRVPAKTRPRQVKRVRVWLGENEKSTKNAVFRIRGEPGGFSAPGFWRCRLARTRPASSTGSEGESASGSASACRAGAGKDTPAHHGTVRQPGDTAR